LSFVLVHQAHIRFMHQCGSLQCLARFLIRELMGRELAQLVVDERQQLRRGVWIALFDGGQDAHDLAHSGEDNLRSDRQQSSGLWTELAVRQPQDLEGDRPTLHGLRRRTPSQRLVAAAG